MSDREAADRIDALRRAIDKAVTDLNEAWGGFGPSELLENAVSDLQRARTNDDIAQGRDWPPVVLAAPPGDTLAAARQAVIDAAIDLTSKEPRGTLAAPHLLAAARERDELRRLVTWASERLARNLRDAQATIRRPGVTFDKWPVPVGDHRGPWTDAEFAALDPETRWQGIAFSLYVDVKDSAATGEQIADEARAALLAGGEND